MEGGGEMNKCSTCKYVNCSYSDIPCNECHLMSDFPLFEPNSFVQSLIDQAEKKAFEAGREVGISHWILDMDTTAEEDYKKWKEAK